MADYDVAINPNNNSMKITNADVGKLLFKGPCHIKSIYIRDLAADGSGSLIIKDNRETGTPAIMFETDENGTHTIEDKWIQGFKLDTLTSGATAIIDFG
jgi:hypothetical protein